MFRENEEGLVESIYPIESLCNLCIEARSCFIEGDMKDDYLQISSENLDGEGTYIVECSGFKPIGKKTMVDVKVEENCPDLSFLQMLHSFYKHLPKNIKKLDDIRKHEKGISVREYERIP